MLVHVHVHVCSFHMKLLILQPSTHLILGLLVWLNPSINEYCEISEWKLKVLKTFVQFDAKLLPDFVTCILRRRTNTAYS